MEKTIEELYEIIKTQQAQIKEMEDHLRKLQEHSDYNDVYLYELIENLTYSVDYLAEKMKEK